MCVSVCFSFCLFELKITFVRFVLFSFVQMILFAFGTYKCAYGAKGERERERESKWNRFFASSSSSSMSLTTIQTESYLACHVMSFDTFNLCTHILGFAQRLLFVFICLVLTVFPLNLPQILSICFNVILLLLPAAFRKRNNSQRVLYCRVECECVCSIPTVCAVHYGLNVTECFMHRNCIQLLWNRTKNNTRCHLCTPPTTAQHAHCVPVCERVDNMIQRENDST